jgi:penicillin-binding protein 1A
MTEDDPNGHARTAQADRVGTVLAPNVRRERPRRGLFRRRRRRRIRWLRLIAILIPLLFLALISFVFGIVLAYAPQIEGLTAQLKVQYTNGVSSQLWSQDGKEIGILTAGTQVFLPPQDIPKVMADAIVAIEDKRFYSEPGVDIKGIARAFIADVFHTGGGLQGASTITEQFVKLALHQERNRTLLEKLREAALAFQLAHLWPKKEILADYLDTAYFGNGAYGVEAAARAYFGNDPTSNLYGCGQSPRPDVPSSLCVTNLTPDEAALLAAAVDAPSDFNGLQDASAALDRRNLVLSDMQEQGYLSPYVAQSAEMTSLPPPEDVGLPLEEGTNKSDAYFVNWIENQLLYDPLFKKRFGTKIFTAGYHIHTTLNYKLQEDAQNVVDQILPPGIGGPAAALVAIDNSNGEVRAMVGGYNYYKDPYNLAVEGERQPGSSFKVFDLAAALEDGYTANSKIYSGPFDLPDPPFGTFVVRNDEGGYYNEPIPLSLALAVSDNSVFSRLGLVGVRGAGLPPVGPHNIAALANRFGITTTVSFNPSMVIGGLHIGVTPLDMAHAYETIAQNGVLTSGSLASQTCAAGGTRAFKWEEAPPAGPCPGAVGVTLIYQPGKGGINLSNTTSRTAVYPADLAEKEKAMMRGVLAYPGTAAAAAIPGVAAWGKTGTTNNYADAWFVGSTPRVGAVPSMTVAVWVGYPTGDRSMLHNFGGHPVYGGTFPAEIWRAYVEKAISYYNHPAHHRRSTAGTSGGTAPVGPTTPAVGATATAAPTGPASAGSGATNTTTPPTGATGTPATATTTPSTGTVTPATGTTAPSAGATGPTAPATATGGAGGTTPATTTPATTTPATITPGNSPTVTPPSTGAGGGVTAPPG